MTEIVLRFLSDKKVGRSREEAPRRPLFPQDGDLAMNPGGMQSMPYISRTGMRSAKVRTDSWFRA